MTSSGAVLRNGLVAVHASTWRLGSGRRRKSYRLFVLHLRPWPQGARNARLLKDADGAPSGDQR